MKVKIKLVKTKKELDTFYAFFSRNLARDFPHYSEKVINYLIYKVYDFKELLKEVKAGERHVFLAEMDKEIAGYLVAGYPYGGVGTCNWIVVDEAFRGQGIASLLLSVWEKQALKDGAHKLQLWTDERNVDFYTKRGFILLGSIPDNYFGATDYFFYKSLRKSKNSGLK